MSASGGGDGSQPECLIDRDSVNSAVNPDYLRDVADERRGVRAAPSDAGALTCVALPRLRKDRMGGTRRRVR